ncbi:MAG: tetratricopeptide repeat protein [bacterium]
MSGLVLVVFFLLMLVGGGILIAYASGSDSSSESDTREHPSAEDISDPNELINLAEKHESRADWTKAKQAWTQLLEEDSERLDALFRRGICHYRTGDYDRAIRDFETVLEDDSQDPPVALHLYIGRAYENLDQFKNAYSHYTTYIEEGDPDSGIIKTTADLARQLEKWSQASTYYETLREDGDPEAAADAVLALADMAFQRKMSDRAEPYLERLEELNEEDVLTSNQQLTYRYLQAKALETEEKYEEADSLIRAIYQDDPSFRDVKDRVEQQIADLDPENLPRKFQRMNHESFRDFCQRIIEGMGYELVESEQPTPEELDVIARERSMGLKVTRVLFTFKQWNETAGEIPVKEFEFKIVENRHDKGFFVSPAGFKPAAERYAQGNESLELIGPKKILSHFKDWYLSDIHGAQ